MRPLNVGSFDKVAGSLSKPFFLYIYIIIIIKLKKIYFHKNTISITANTSVLIVIVYHLISSTSSDV